MWKASKCREVEQVVSLNIINETVRRLSTGESFLAIAKDMEINCNTLYYAFRHATGKSVKEIKPRSSRLSTCGKWLQINQGTIDEAVRRLEAGGYVAEIAKHAQVDYVTLYRAIKKATGKTVKEIRHHLSYPSERHKKALKLLDSGVSISEAAREVGVSRQAVSLWVKKRGIGGLLSSKRQAQEKARELIRERKLSQAEISERTGVCRSIVLAIAHEERIRLPRPVRKPHPAYAAAIHDLQQGLGYQEVAEKYGLSVSCSYKWAVKTGARQKVRGRRG